MNIYINEFAATCKRNLLFMEKFLMRVSSLESSFDRGWGSNPKLNNFFYEYERGVLSQHLKSINRDKVARAPESGNKAPIIN